ncbi:hypothetical protein M436DRAFT_78283 [Aureobasidium namibiae CBS 147.97]|uniref:Fungal N-terminal domain-containing protein n=1 Tax=Aureobasidium namibiae CBS 147.97 TaxID=1043004 RepID=A0A074WTK0_9PEZI
MSKDIVCARAEAAGPMPLALSSYQTTCKALIGRMQAKLNTENIYLLTYISKAIHQLELCESKSKLFKYSTKNFSKNIVFALQDNSDRMLDAVRRLESFVRPVEHDWVTVPLNVKTQCNFVCDALFLVASHMCLLDEVATLSRTSRSKYQTLYLNSIRNHVVKMRATMNRTYILKEDSKKSPPPMQMMEKSETKPKKSLEHVSIPIIDAMSAEITDRDIATLVFKWTTLDKFNEFSRVSSQQEPVESKSPQIYVEEKSDNKDKIKHRVKSRRGKLWALAYLSFM